MPALTPAQAVCNALTRNIATRKCLAPGGLKTRMWVFQLADLTGVETFNSAGSLSSFGVAPGAQVITCTGRAKKNVGDNKITQAEDAAVAVEQGLALEVAYGDQSELDAVMTFLRADAKTVFVEGNDGNVRQYFHEFGTSTLDGSDGSGALIGDAANVVKATVKGQATTLPRFFEAVITGAQSQLAASRAYLDALVTGTATI